MVCQDRRRLGRGQGRRGGKLTAPGDRPDVDAADARLIEGFNLDAGPQWRDHALKVAGNAPGRCSPEDARRIRRLVGLLSSADEIRRRNLVVDPRCNVHLTPEGIAQRAAAVRRGWTDDRGVLRGPRADKFHHGGTQNTE